jgi:general secretion pathway protein N
MTVQLPFRRSILFAGLILLELIALLPSRLGLSWFGLTGAGLSAREVAGSVWMGTLSEARFGPIALGDVRARLNLLPLLIGRAWLDLQDLSGTAIGAISANAGSAGIDDVSATFPIDGLLAPLPSGNLTLTNVTVHFRDHECREATGSVRLRFLEEANGRALPPEFSGTVRCDSGALLLPLSGPGGETLKMRVFGRGGYRATVSIRTTDQVTRDRALTEGFIARGDSLSMEVAGNF